LKNDIAFLQTKNAPKIVIPIGATAAIIAIVLVTILFILVVIDAGSNVAPSAKANLGNVATTKAPVATTSCLCLTINFLMLLIIKTP
jgi:hypothetical protein